MSRYDYKSVEAKWQKYWEEHETFKTDVWDFSKPKFYALDMFPYPSGVGLHAGHPEGYTATDIISRMKRMQGYNVLHPMGYDSFGLPAEQYAVTTGNHPNGFTQENIKTFKEFLSKCRLVNDPLLHVLSYNRIAASLGFSVNYLVVGKNGTQLLAPVYRHIYVLCIAIFIELFEYPLSPLVELRIGCCDHL